MSEFRRDPTTLEWVLIAPERAHRPNDPVELPREGNLAAWEPNCPFCPGNEHLAPHEILRIPGNKGWRVRIVPNKFAALAPSESAEDRSQLYLFKSKGGVGYHEVVVETPVHNRQLTDMETAEVEDVLRAYRRRYNRVRRDPGIRLIIIFRNQGMLAGTSLVHPHSQMVAIPLVPPVVRRRCEVARDYHKKTGRCVFCSLINAEIADGERLIFQSDYFAAIQPFASKVPFETWIMPKRHISDFGEISDPEIQDLAVVLRDILKALAEALDHLDFNYVFRTAPAGEHGRYLWHIQIFPRTISPAGFELGSGISINPMAPEEAASHLRRHARRSVDLDLGATASG